MARRVASLFDQSRWRDGKCFASGDSPSVSHQAVPTGCIRENFVRRRVSAEDPVGQQRYTGEARGKYLLRSCRSCLDILCESPGRLPTRRHSSFENLAGGTWQGEPTRSGTKRTRTSSCAYSMCTRPVRVEATTEGAGCCGARHESTTDT
jgi:hypothetical protein